MNLFGGKGGAGAGPAMARPIPRPAMGPGAGAAMSAPSPSGGGFFPNLTPQQRYDSTMQFLAQGMQMAAQSGSPLLAFAAPLAGAAIGGSAQSRMNAATGDANASILASLAPGGQVSPEMAKLAKIAEDPSTPDYLKSMATERIKAALNPKVPVGGGSGTAAKKDRKAWYDRGYSNTDAMLSAMMSDAYNPDGPGGPAVTPGEQAAMDDLQRRRSRKSSATIDYGSNDSDPLGVGAGSEKDPLGILN